MTYEYLFRSDTQDSWGWYEVEITKPGPRGGKRPPLIHARLRAADYNDAMEYVAQEYLRRCTVKVTY